MTKLINIIKSIVIGIIIIGILFAGVLTGYALLLLVVGGLAIFVSYLFISNKTNKLKDKNQEGEIYKYL